MFQSVVNDFEAANPGVKVDVHASQADTKIIQVMSTGNSVDVALVNVNNTLGPICKALADLQPYMDRDGVKVDDFQGVFATMTAVDGRRCALPTTSDVYGLYYSTEMFKAAGITSPPKTLDELEQDGLKLTQYNADGSIKVLGFNPLVGFEENVSSTFGAMANAAWMKDGQSSIASDPNWTKLIQWQKAYVDKIGYDKLKTFSAGLGDEWSAKNAFQTGQLAMALDGEWRVAFIADQAPNLKYATAPLPTLDGTGQVYGGSWTSAASVGVSDKSQNKELAWALVRYLTTDPGAAVKIANGLQNIPTLKAAAQSSDLKVPEQYKTFVESSQSEGMSTTPITTLGATLTQTMDSFWVQYQQTDGSRLADGLTQVDTDINNSLLLKTTGG